MRIGGFLAALIGVLAAYTACKKSEPAPTDVLLSKITEERQLMPGTAASGRIGDWLFDNGTVRFIVQDAGSATGWGVHGGSLVDLSIGPTRDDGPEDHLQEIFFHCDLRAFRPESAQLINDGSDGQPAVLRMVGKDGGFPLLDSLLRSRPIGVEATIEYRLAAGSDTLEIRQVVTDTQREGRREVLCGAVVLRGDGYAGFAAGQPEGDEGINGEIEYIAASAPGIPSWVFYPTDVEALDTFSPTSEVLFMNHVSEELRENDTRTYSYALTVAPRGTESALAARRRRLKRPEPERQVELTIRAEAALRPFLKDAVVSFVETDRSKVVTAAHADADGKLSVRVPPGAYETVVRIGGVAYDRKAQDIRGTSGTQQLTTGLTEVGVIAVRGFANDERGPKTPTPTKITLFSGHDANTSSGGSPRYVAPEDAFIARTGQYTLVATLGPEYDLYKANIEVTAGQRTEVEAVVPRVVDSTGWVSGDFHVHQASSMDSTTARRWRILGAPAEGLDVLVSTDHDIATDYRPLAKEMGLDHLVAYFTGIEASPLYGHMNAYPLPEPKDETYWGIRWWSYDDQQRFERTLDPHEVAAALRQSGAKVVQINHPRESQGIFNFIELDGETGQSSLQFPDANAVEVYNSYSDVARVRGDWFTLMATGRRLTAVGVSDAHGVFGVGKTRTWIAHAQDDPSKIEREPLFSALADGKAFLSTAPFVTFEAHRGGGTAGLGETLQGPGPVDLRARVQAPSWVQLSKMTVYINGEVTHEREVTADMADPADPATRIVTTFTATPTADAFVVFQVEGDGATRNHPVNGERPFALTNPIFLDIDGNGLSFANGM